MNGRELKLGLPILPETPFWKGLATTSPTTAAYMWLKNDETKPESPKPFSRLEVTSAAAIDTVKLFFLKSIVDILSQPFKPETNYLISILLIGLLTISAAEYLILSKRLTAVPVK